MKTIIAFLITVVFFVQTAFASVVIGKASYYSDKLHGRKTASGQVYNKTKLTAAHRTLPFGSLVKVTNVKTKKSVVVEITDRGPFSKKRAIDLSRAAMSQIDGIRSGVIVVELEVIRTGK